MGGWSRRRGRVRACWTGGRARPEEWPPGRVPACVHSIDHGIAKTAHRAPRAARSGLAAAQAWRVAGCGTPGPASRITLRVQDHDQADLELPGQVSRVLERRRGPAAAGRLRPHPRRGGRRRSARHRRNVREPRRRWSSHGSTNMLFRTCPKRPADRTVAPRSRRRRRRVASASAPPRAGRGLPPHRAASASSPGPRAAGRLGARRSSVRMWGTPLGAPGRPTIAALCGSPAGRGAPAAGCWCPIRRDGARVLASTCAGRARAPRG